jgi:hypothetical protein
MGELSAGNELRLPGSRDYVCLKKTENNLRRPVTVSGAFTDRRPVDANDVGGGKGSSGAISNRWLVFRR